MYHTVTRAGFVHILPRGPPNLKLKVLPKPKGFQGFRAFPYLKRILSPRWAHIPLDYA